MLGYGGKWKRGGLSHHNSHWQALVTISQIANVPEVHTYAYKFTCTLQWRVYENIQLLEKPIFCMLLFIFRISQELLQQFAQNVEHRITINKARDWRKSECNSTFLCRVLRGPTSSRPVLSRVVSFPVTTLKLDSEGIFWQSMTQWLHAVQKILCL